IMRYVSAYLLAVAGGNPSPKLDDIKNILGAVGVDTDAEAAKLVLVAEIDQELAALWFVSEATLPNKLKELSKYYPSLKFIEGHIHNSKN
ncbi:hypothetical protein TELCIR_20251, partial [Teladorsagia circumcincta]